MKKSTDIRTLKNLDQPIRYSIPNSPGLHLWVRQDLKKYWVYRYTFCGKRFDTSLGSFPEVMLADARKKHQALRGQVLNGINPVDKKREQRESKSSWKKTVRFSEFAEAYTERMSPQWSNKIHAMQWVGTIKSYANPIIGDLTLEEITTDDIVDLLSPIWLAKHETAIRVRGRVERIISAAITNGLRTKPNPAIWRGHLENLLPKIKRKHKHFSAAPYKELPAIMKKLRSDDSITSLVLQFIILNASRTSEATYAKRSEVSGSLWTIPAERIKARSEHVVPLSNSSLEIIAKAQQIYPHSEYIFSNFGKPIYALKVLLKTRSIMEGITVHGFRSAFRDWIAEETNHSPEVAEMALAHAIPNKVEAAYRRGRLIERRRLLLADWEAYCLSAS